MSSEHDSQVDPRRLLAVLWHRAWVIAAFTALAALVAYGAARRAPNTYQATNEVRISNPNAANVFSNPAGNINVDPKRLVDTETQVLQSNDIRIAVNQKLGDQAALAGALTVTNPTGTDLLDITVASTSPEVARDAANAFADVYVAKRRDQAASELSAKASQLRQQADDLTKQILNLPVSDPQRSTLQNTAANFTNLAIQYETQANVLVSNVQVVDSAQTPSAPVSPKPLRDAALAGAFGFLVGVGLVLVLDRLDDRLGGPEEIEEMVPGVPLLGSVPIYNPKRKRGARRLPHGPRSLVPLNSVDSEVYRNVRSNLRFSNLSGEKSVIMVTSPSGSEGKSTVTANLAVSLAESGQRVVVVSADLRRPVLSGIFGIDETKKGLTSVLIGEASITDCLVPITLESDHRLFVLPSGPLPHNPAELLGSQAMADLVQALRRADVDYIFIDCPPVLPVSDPLAVAQFVDGVIVLSVVGQTRAHHLQEACNRLQKVGADIIGIILNGVPTAGGRYPYYYYRRYGNYGPYAPNSPVDQPPTNGHAASGDPSMSASSVDR